MGFPKNPESLKKKMISRILNFWCEKLIILYTTHGGNSLDLVTEGCAVGGKRGGCCCGGKGKDLLLLRDEGEREGGGRRFSFEGRKRLHFV